MIFNIIASAIIGRKAKFKRNALQIFVKNFNVQTFDFKHSIVL